MKAFLNNPAYLFFAMMAFVVLAFIPTIWKVPYAGYGLFGWANVSAFTYVCIVGALLVLPLFIRAMYLIKKR